MELSKFVEQITKNLSVETYESCKVFASTAKKFRWENSGYNITCSFCGKTTKRYGYVRGYTLCSSCTRKVGRAVILSLSLGKVHKKEYSRGIGHGYSLATENNFGRDSLLFLSMIVDDAKKENRQVHFLGRDMDLFYLYFQLEDNTNYLQGWNRCFVETFGDTPKEKLLVRNNVQENDYVVDTGFVGSIIEDIECIIPVKGYLLSANPSTKYSSLYTYQENYAYRDWICRIEHFVRAREVSFTEDNMPYECYKNYSWYEQGMFCGFLYGANEVMR